MKKKIYLVPEWAFWSALAIIALSTVNGLLSIALRVIEAL